MTDHPMQPTPEQSGEWWAKSSRTVGSDAELEEFCEWLKGDGFQGTAIVLRDARRPKPPSLKQQALKDFEALPEETP